MILPVEMRPLKPQVSSLKFWKYNKKYLHFKTVAGVLLLTHYPYYEKRVRSKSVYD